MPKFMQSLGAETYRRLATEAKARDVTVQSLIRTVIVPDWLKAAPTAPSLQTALSKPIIQPTTPLLTHTGIVTEPARRPFLTSTIGRR
ncbi:hypothetical protein J2P12_08350 [Candidatus Bathyarchaeota archaeon]|nr:hypothetical protein [Candidatus Bathyarchaeota archaeon]